jgi:hypothetical protein
MAEKKRLKAEALAAGTFDNSVAKDPAMTLSTMVPNVGTLEALDRTFAVKAEALARGNFGVVYEGVRRGEGSESGQSFSDAVAGPGGRELERVAVKRLRKMTKANVSAIAREVEVMTVLRGHKGLVQLLSPFEDDTDVGLVLEFVPGGDLLQAIANSSSPYTEADARNMSTQLLEALHFMHVRKVSGDGGGGGARAPSR